MITSYLNGFFGNNMENNEISWFKMVDHGVKDIKHLPLEVTPSPDSNLSHIAVLLSPLFLSFSRPVIASLYTLISSVTIHRQYIYLFWSHVGASSPNEMSVSYSCRVPPTAVSIYRYHLYLRFNPLLFFSRKTIPL